MENLTRKLVRKSCTFPLRQHVLWERLFIIMNLGMPATPLFPHPMCNSSKAMCSRAAEFLGGIWRQTPPLSWTQNVSAYQFLGPYNIVLPRHESFEVGHFKDNLLTYMRVFGFGQKTPPSQDGCIDHCKVGPS